MSNTRQVSNVEHFGEKLRESKFGHRMTRELYAYPSRAPKQRRYREELGERSWEESAWVYRDDEHAQHSDLYLLVQRDQALVNFDLSLRYFESLDRDEFEEALQHVLLKGRTFKPVVSLQDWEGVAGAYVMVFDDYKQFYIGQSEDIRKRIKKHWTARKPFDRLVFGSPYNSVFPMDEFRALDNTRLYAARSRNPYAVEERAEKAADRRFSLNRMAGGEADPWALMMALSIPRGRNHEPATVPLSYEDYEEAWQEIANLITQAGVSPRQDLVARLAGADMTIYSISRDTGGSFMWSRRDSIRGAAARGELSVDEYSAFLTAIGERVVWPD